MRTGFALIVFALVGCGASTFTSAPGDDAGDGGQTATDAAGRADGASPLDAAGGLSDTAPQPAASEDSKHMACGANTCTLPAQMCCITAGIAKCQDTVIPCTTTALYCTSATNCGSAKKCCIDSFGSGSKASCMSSCSGEQMCDQNEIPSTCASPDTCSTTRNADFGLVGPNATCQKP